MPLRTRCVHRSSPQIPSSVGGEKRHFASHFSLSKKSEANPSVLALYSSGGLILESRLSRKYASKNRFISFCYIVDTENKVLLKYHGIQGPCLGMHTHKEAYLLNS